VFERQESLAFATTSGAITRSSGPGAEVGGDGDGGQKTGDIYRRYAIVDEAMIRDAAGKKNRRREGSANYCTTNCTIRSAERESLKSLGNPRTVRWPRG
jgi:hypothetical protein